MDGVIVEANVSASSTPAGYLGRRQNGDPLGGVAYAKIAPASTTLYGHWLGNPLRTVHRRWWRTRREPALSLGGSRVMSISIRLSRQLGWMHNVSRKSAEGGKNRMTRSATIKESKKHVVWGELVKQSRYQ
jgi:hypothetical protein